MQQADAAARPRLRALVVDDEKNIRKTLEVYLEGMGCIVATAAGADTAMAAVEREPFDLAFLDLRLGVTSGIDLLPRLLAARPKLAVVVITAYATVDTAVAAMKR